MPVSLKAISGKRQLQAYLRKMHPKDIDSLINYISAKPYAKGVEHVTKDMAKEKF